MIKPVGHRVLVKPDDIEDTTAGGIVLIQDERLEKASQVFGTLVAIGDQAWKAFSPDYTGEPWAKVGDRISYSRFAGKNLKDPETKEEFIVMNDEDVVAVITGEGK